MSYIGANFNFVEQAAAKDSKNLFVGETLSGSVAEVRAWDSLSLIHI